MAFNEYENMHSTIRTVDQLLEDIQDLDRAVNQYQWANEKQGDFIRKVYERLGIFQDEEKDEGVNVDVCFNKALSELDNRISQGEQRVLGGVGWPRFTDGSPVRFGDKIDGLNEEVQTIILFSDGCFGIGDDLDTESCECFDSGTRVKRPAPKVLDADGVEIHKGDALYNAETGYSVTVIGFADGEVVANDSDGCLCRIQPDAYTHRAPVLDADGVKIKVGDALYSVEGGLKLHVGVIDTRNGKIATAEMYALDKWADPAMYTHRVPVIAADGKPLRKGETVWRTTEAGAWEILALGEKSGDVKIKRVDVKDGPVVWAYRNFLTHERPDSWERLEDDAVKSTCEYFDNQSYGCGSCPHYPSECQIDKARDLVRRAKALAERGQ